MGIQRIKRNFPRLNPLNAYAYFKNVYFSGTKIQGPAFEILSKLLMRIKLYHIIFLFGCLFASTTSFAQENTESMDSEVKSYMPGGESQPFDSRDSVYSRPVLQPKNSESIKNTSGHGKEGEEGDDSVLSFNFLYYIIQKFKMSDLVDP